MFLIYGFVYSIVPTGDFHVNNAISKDDTAPIVVVIPGLTSDSTSAVRSIFHYLEGVFLP